MGVATKFVKIVAKIRIFCNSMSKSWQYDQT